MSKGRRKVILSYYLSLVSVVMSQERYIQWYRSVDVSGLIYQSTLYLLYIDQTVGYRVPSVSVPNLNPSQSSQTPTHTSALSIPLRWMFGQVVQVNTNLSDTIQRVGSVWYFIVYDESKIPQDLISLNFLNSFQCI